VPERRLRGREMETLVYAANILYLLSYMVRDILLLRIFTIIAACCLVTYFYNQAEPLMTVVYWNLFFVAMNAIQLAFILRKRFLLKI
jgi:hypothetical protein